MVTISHLICTLHGRRIHLIDRTVLTASIVHRNEPRVPCESSTVKIGGRLWTPSDIKLGLHNEPLPDPAAVADEALAALRAMRPVTVSGSTVDSGDKARLPRRDRKRHRHPRGAPRAAE